MFEPLLGKQSYCIVQGNHPWLFIVQDDDGIVAKWSWLKTPASKSREGEVPIEVRACRLGAATKKNMPC